MLKDLRGKGQRGVVESALIEELVKLKIGD